MKRFIFILAGLLVITASAFSQVDSTKLVCDGKTIDTKRMILTK